MPSRPHPPFRRFFSYQSKHAGSSPKSVKRRDPLPDPTCSPFLLSHFPPFFFVVTASPVFNGCPADIALFGAFSFFSPMSTTFFFILILFSLFFPPQQCRIQSHLVAPPSPLGIELSYTHLVLNFPPPLPSTPPPFFI